VSVSHGKEKGRSDSLEGGGADKKKTAAQTQMVNERKGESIGRKAREGSIRGGKRPHSVCAQKKKKGTRKGGGPLPPTTEGSIRRGGEDKA